MLLLLLTFVVIADLYLDMYHVVELWIACGSSFVSSSLAPVGSLLLRVMFVRVLCILVLMLA